MQRVGSDEIGSNTHRRWRLVGLELLDVEVLNKVYTLNSSVICFEHNSSKNAPRRATVLVAKVRCERATVRAYL